MRKSMSPAVPPMIYWRQAASNGSSQTNKDLIDLEAVKQPRSSKHKAERQGVWRKGSGEDNNIPQGEIIVAIEEQLRYAAVG